jgi:hypothetical protein
VVVAVGLTACVPPLGSRVYELPSLPATVTAVALVAVTVKVDESPAATEVGLAAIATAGAGDVLIRLPLTHPVVNRESKRPGIAPQRIERRDLGTRTLIMVSSSLFAGQA